MMISAPIRISILLILGLVLLSQVIFLPIPLSILFAIAIMSVGYSLKRQMKISKVWTFLFIVLSLATIFLSHQSFIGVEAGVAVLTTFLFAKALESKTTRDLVVLFNFALFVSASSFLFSQAIWMAVLVILSLMSCLIGLYRLQTSQFISPTHASNTLTQDLKQVVRCVIYALPFFVLLFLFFPRLPPLWHIPIPENKGVTGISDRMSPGDIAALSQSAALAFRIIGDINQMPARSELYWRAMVLDEYGGQTWTSSFFNQQPLQLSVPDQTKIQQGWDYQYLATDFSVMWIMGLEKSIPLERRYYNRQDWGIVPRRLMQRSEPIPLRWLKNDIQGVFEYPEFLIRMNTKFRPEYDLRAQQFAHDLYEKNGRKPEQYIQAVLKWYQDQNFVYTLMPGILGQHRIDEFLFKSQQGFCEHYAASFVMLMRYVGIPARVVAGYQGGQIAPDAESWEVRQLDAHAWTEVLLDGRWQRIDPTAMIAPNRIDAGMQTMLSEDDRVFGERNALAKRSFHLLNKMHIWSDYATYQWQSKVIGYNAEKQRTWLSQWGLNSIYATVIILITSLVGLVGVYILGIYIYKRFSRTPLQRAVDRLNRYLPQTLKRIESETFQQWMQRIADSVESSQSEKFMHAASLYDEICYGRAKDQVQDEYRLVAMLKTCADVLKKKVKHLS